MQKISVFWFRRDLRLFDNHGLNIALKDSGNVLCIFIFDQNILSELKDPKDRRINFIHQELMNLNHSLRQWGSTLSTFFGDPLEVFTKLNQQYQIQAIYTNRDYEPYAISRDLRIYDYFKARNISFYTFKDQVIFEKNEILKPDGRPYSVYTPYSRIWKERLTNKNLENYPIEPYKSQFLKIDSQEIIKLQELGFEFQNIIFPAKEIDPHLIMNYEQTRDFPAQNGTSRMSVHLRFGTVSIRNLVECALQFNHKFLNELIWREFYMMILFHHPHVVSHSFKPKYDQITWRNNTKDFLAWCNGQTGYPMVDAGMRELNATGFMHNRVRMVAASFLTKHLLIDWRWGEAYFAEKLLDYELSSNVGGWQWAAGSGCDAAPYFRIFNPEIQLKKFDPDLKYTRSWIPEYGTDAYPLPIVDHKLARERALEIYRLALSLSSG